MKKKIEIRVTKLNVLASMFLVALNAFAENPPFGWNMIGWFWMTMPFMYAVYIFIVLWVLYAIGNIIDHFLK